MAQDVLQYNVVIVGKLLDKGSWMSDVWRREHPEEFDVEPDGLAERIQPAEERRQLLNLDHDPERAVCADLWHTTSTGRSVDVC